MCEDFHIKQLVPYIWMKMGSFFKAFNTICENNCVLDFTI